MEGMSKLGASPCPECERLQALVGALQAQVGELQGAVARLHDQLAAARKNSATSSKPPSSDIVKPPKTSTPEQATPKAPGGQPGHPKHERALLPAEQVQDFFEHRPPPCCPDCGHDLRPTGFGPRIVQHIDIAVLPLHVAEHRRHEAYCPVCDKVHYLYSAPPGLSMVALGDCPRISPRSPISPGRIDLLHLLRVLNFDSGQTRSAKA
jgi:hypothetical protein